MTLGPTTDRTIRNNSEKGAVGFRWIATATATAAGGVSMSRSEDALIESVGE